MNYIFFFALEDSIILTGCERASPGSRKRDRVGDFLNYYTMRTMAKTLMFLFLSICMTIFTSCSKDSAIMNPDVSLESDHFNHANQQTSDMRRPWFAFIGIKITFGHNELNPHYEAGNGEPIILECISSGLCKIEINEVGNNDNIAYPTNIDGSLVIYFEKSSMDIQGLESFLNGNLVVYEDIQLQDDWIRELGFRDGYLIEAGSYDVIDDGEYYIVYF